MIVGLFAFPKVPLKFKLPAPENVNWQPVVPVVIAPLIFTVPVEIVIILFLVIVVAAIVRAPALSEPAPTAIVKFVLLTVGCAILNNPEMFSELVPLIVIEPLVIVVKVAQEAEATLTVTEILLLMMTASEAVGTGLLPQVAVEFQLPETVAVLVNP